MNLQIYNFEAIEELAKEPFSPHTALISIGDPDAPPPRILHWPAWILRLNFDDIEPDEVEGENGKYVLFDRAMAEKIAEFVYRHKEEAVPFMLQMLKKIKVPFNARFSFLFVNGSFPSPGTKGSTFEPCTLRCCFF